MGAAQEGRVARCASPTRVASSSTRPRSRSRRAGRLAFWLAVALAGSNCDGVRGQREDYDYGGYQQQAPMRAG